MIYSRRYLLPLLLIAMHTGMTRPDAPPSLDVLVDRLLSGNQEVIPLLLKQREASLSLLRQRMKPDVKVLAPLLKQLGADNYGDRVQAVKILGNMGSGIRDHVMLFKNSNRRDPEIAFRAQQVLDRLGASASPDADTAVVSFLVACGEVDPELINSARYMYQRVFEQKEAAFFRGTKRSGTQKEYLHFVQQYLQIPGTREPLVEWLLRESDQDRTVSAFRILFQDDFKTTFALTYRESKYSSSLDRLIAEEFSDLVDAHQILTRVKIKYDRVRQASDIEFDPEQPVTPETAFHIMNQPEMDSLKSHEYDLLIEKLSAMSREELLARIAEKPINVVFMHNLAGRRADLHQDLEKIIRVQLKEIVDLRTWTNYMLTAQNILGMELQIGELDAEWIHLMASAEKTSGMSVWRTHDYRISPSVILPYLKETKSAIQANPSLYSNLFEYLLEAEDAEIRGEVVDFMLEDYTINKRGYSGYLQIWTALLKNPELGNPGLAQKKLTFLESNRLAPGLDFIKYLREKVPSDDLQHTLWGFYNAHKALIHRMFQEDALSDSAFTMLCLLINHPELSGESTRILRNTLMAFLRNDESPGKNRFYALEAALNVGIQDAGWLDAFVDHVQKTEYRNVDPLLWRLDARHRVWLPEIEKRLTSGGPGKIPLLCAGILVDPNFPAWESEIESVLHGGHGPEEVVWLIRTLQIPNREPDLSLLTAERLGTLFDASTQSKYDDTVKLLKEIRRPGNKRIALLRLADTLEKAMGYFNSGWALAALFHDFPESWDMVGESLLALANSENKGIATNAAISLSRIDGIPASAFPRIHALIKNPETPERAALSLFPLVAEQGRRASAMTPAIREFSFSKPWMEGNRQFVLASISPDPEERYQNLLQLQEYFVQGQFTNTLQEIGNIRGFDTERAAFFRGLLEKEFSKKGNPATVRKLRVILYSLTNFSDPGIGVEAYKEALTRLAAADFAQSDKRLLSGVIFEKLISDYPDRLSEFTPFIANLPENCKTSWEYRYIKERSSTKNPPDNRVE